MNQAQYTVLSNRKIAYQVFEMKLKGDTSAITRPGQFVNLEIDGFYLRRPLSVCDRTENALTLVYKIMGRGTEKLSRMGKGTVIDMLSGLGNGYDVQKSGDRPALIGGGCGVPPLYLLCRELVSAGKKPLVILGFNSERDVFYEAEFRALGAKVKITTMDGTLGLKGVATDALSGEAYTYVYCCGPEPMLKAVFRESRTSGEFSFEERMGCGFGACMGCSCKTVTGYKRICTEGPVLQKEEILWQT